MKKNLLVVIPLLIILLLATLLTFFRNNVDPVEKKETIIIGLDTDFPPMGFYNKNNEIDGFDIDLAKAVAKEIGIDVVFQPINWDSKEMELNTGKIHVIWNGLTFSKERSESMLLTKPYMKTKPVVVVKKSDRINKIEDLSGKTVCMQKGALAQDSLIASDVCKNAKEIVYLETMLDCLNEVKLGKVEGAVVDDPIARYYLTKNKAENEFKILEKDIQAEDYVIAVKKGNEKLKNKIEEGLEKIISSGEAARISEKWFGKNLICFEKENTQSLNNNKKEGNGNNVAKGVVDGLLVTLKLFFSCLLFSVPLGLLICLIRRRNIKLLNILIDLYTLIIRGTPLLLQIFFIFYGLPLLFSSIKINNRFLAGTLAFVVNYTAYFSEIFRGGINSIPKGQWEAITVLQIPKIKAIKKIIIPQSLKACLPSLCNETITLVKDTALIFSIGIIDLLSATKNIVNTSANVAIYAVTAAIYLAVCFILSAIFKVLEKKFSYKS